MKMQPQTKRAKQPAAATPRPEGVEAPLTKEQVGVLLGIHPETIGKWAKEGRLPAHKAGRLLRFFWSEVRGWMSASRTGH